MFQTEPIIFLQSFDHPAVIWFFTAVTSLGYREFYIPFFAVLMFGVHFRAGLIVFHSFLMTALFTQFFKDLLAMPRPPFVDSNVLLLGKDYPNDTVFTSMGAKSFFGPLPQQIIDIYRAGGDDSFGIPSGHVAGATVVWGTLAISMRQRIFTAWALFVIVAMPLSRMYLGRHFPGGVLAGLLLGGIVVFLAYAAILRQPVWGRFLTICRFGAARASKRLLVFAYLLLLPAFLLTVPGIESRLLGYVLGMNTGFIFLLLRGLPEEGGSSAQRMVRVLIALPVILTAYYGGEWFFLTFFGEYSVLTLFIRNFLVGFLTVAATTELCVRLKLFTRREP